MKKKNNYFKGRQNTVKTNTNVKKMYKYFYYENKLHNEQIYDVQLYFSSNAMMLYK